MYGTQLIRRASIQSPTSVHALGHTTGTLGERYYRFAAFSWLGPTHIDNATTDCIACWATGSLDSETPQSLYAATPTANFASRSSNNFVYTFQFAEGVEATGNYVPDVWSISSPFALPTQLAQLQALQVLQLDDSSEESIGPEDLVMLKPRKFTPFNP